MNLEDKLICQKDTIEQSSLNNQILVFRLDEDVSIPEKNKNKFLEFCSSKFPGIPLVADDIISARRIGRKTNTTVRPIVVTFSNLKLRSTILKNRKNLKGTRISVNETLTKNRLTLLFYAKGKLGLRNAWTIER